MDFGLKMFIIQQIMIIFVGKQTGLYIFKWWTNFVQKRNETASDYFINYIIGKLNNYGNISNNN